MVARLSSSFFWLKFQMLLTNYLSTLGISKVWIVCLSYEEFLDAKPSARFEIVPTKLQIYFIVGKVLTVQKGQQGWCFAGRGTTRITKNGLNKLSPYKFAHGLNKLSPYIVNVGVRFIEPVDEEGKG